MDRKLWEPLQRFESRDYITRHYVKLHGNSLNAQRANEIGSCFTQGREYFSSAANASDVVKPLLLYYGVSSLSRGVTLLKNKHKREESLTAGHGLKTVDWPKILSNGLSEVLNLKVQATKGCFTEFVEAVGNKQSYTWFTKELGFGSFLNDFGDIKFLKDGSEITLGDLLSRERGLVSEYMIANDGWGNIDIGVVVATDTSLKIHFSITEHQNGANLLEQYRIPDDSKITIEGDPKYGYIKELKTICVEIPAEGEYRKKVAPLAFEQEKSVGWIVRPLKNGDNIIDIHRMFIESYILGMFCRYFPSKWISLLKSDKGDISRSVVLSAVSRIED